MPAVRSTAPALFAISPVALPTNFKVWSIVWTVPCANPDIAPAYIPAAAKMKPWSASDELAARYMVRKTGSCTGGKALAAHTENGAQWTIEPI